jgi:hypothetical protein
MGDWRDWRDWKEGGGAGYNSGVSPTSCGYAANYLEEKIRALTPAAAQAALLRRDAEQQREGWLAGYQAAITWLEKNYEREAAKHLLKGRDAALKKQVSE